MPMSQHKEFSTNSLKSTFLWDVWLGRDADELPVKILMKSLQTKKTIIKVGNFVLKFIEFIK